MRSTQRGFAIYSSIKDYSGNEVRVQQSSLATQPTVWIFCHPASDPRKQMSPMLTRNQAKLLIAALQKFVDGKP